MTKKDDNKEITRRDIATFSGLGMIMAGLLGRIWGRENYESRKPYVKAATGCLVVPGCLITGIEIGEAMGNPGATDDQISSMSRRSMLGLGLTGCGSALMVGYKTNKQF